MLLTVRICTMMMLGGIAWQDAKSRSVYWFYFPLLIIAFVLLRGFGRYSPLWPDLFVNLNVIFIKLAILTIVLSVRRRRMVWVWQGMLGMGDILFFIALAFYLSVLNFVLFDVVSLVLAALGWRIYNIFYKCVNNHVPLAGMQAVILILLLAADWCWLHFDASSDDWLLKPLLLWNPLNLY